MYVEGRLKTRQYVDAQNVTRYVTEVLVDKMMSMGTKRTQNNSEQVNASYNSYQQSAASYQQSAPSYQQPVAPALQNSHIPAPPYSLPFPGDRWLGQGGSQLPFGSREHDRVNERSHVHVNKYGHHDRAVET